MVNGFSKTWFDTFLAPGTAAPVHRELGFIGEQLPVEAFPRLLDVPCGIGRHAAPLAEMGYRVLGIDRDAAAIDQARRASSPGASYRVLDLAELDSLPAAAFDGVLCLWQSFGYGDARENREVLCSMARRLRPGGRLLLDVYNADALHALPGQSIEKRGWRTVVTRRTWNGPRFHVEIEYSDTAHVDHHEWLVYAPAELAELGASAGLELVSSCAWFDPEVPPGPEHQRVQYLFELPRVPRR